MIVLKEIKFMKTVRGGNHDEIGLCTNMAVHAGLVMVIKSDLLDELFCGESRATCTYIYYALPVHQLYTHFLSL